MSGSLVSNHVHIVFSTRKRAELIRSDHMQAIIAQMVDVIEKYHCPVRAIGGTSNHMHILISLNQECRLSYVVRDVKVATSHWMHEQGLNFEWQAGYGAFSVGQRELGLVTNYIRAQDIHHARFTFDEEFIKMLRHAQIDFNPEYVFG